MRLRQRILAAALCCLLAGGIVLAAGGSDAPYRQVYADGARIWLVDTDSLKDTVDTDGSKLRQGWVITRYPREGTAEKTRYYFKLSQREVKATDSVSFSDQGQATEI